MSTNDIDEEKISCRICGSSETRRSFSGQPIWINDINKKGDFTGKYICYRCNFRSLCSVCGKRGKHMYKVYNARGYWTGDLVCDRCDEEVSRVLRQRAQKLKLMAQMRDMYK